MAQDQVFEIMENGDVQPRPTKLTDNTGEEVFVEYKSPPKRGEWSNRFEFILSCIGTAVGLGNIWRFPYLCLENGGGAFLIPYAITLCFIGLPIFFMELALGQFASLGAIGIWSISPLFKGLGYGMVVVSVIICIYYNIIIAQCLYYFGVSFTNILPWSNCNNTWNNKSICYDGSDNFTAIASRVSPAEEYYEKYVLNISGGINDIGVPQWKLVICLAVCWLIVIVVLLKGIKYLGKVAYFTALFPYVILTILLIRGLCLPGSLNGIKFYIYPKFEYLIKPKVWVTAATQIFFSLSVCNGNLITMSSYNHFKNNCLRDAVLVAVINCATSVYGGFVIFANMGFMAFVKNVNISDVVKGGPGLAFKVYPEALTNMPVSPLWSILFFLMMLTLGMGSQMALVETVLAGFQDELKKFSWFNQKNKIISYRVIICFFGFLLGIPMTCRGGMYILGLIDEAMSGFTMLVLAVTEMLVISYCYGIRRFYHDIELMIGFKPSKFWKYCWMFISPSFIIILIISLGIFSESDGYKYSTGFLFLKYSISMFPLALIFFVFLYVYCIHGGWLLFTELRKPIYKWGPAQEENKLNFMNSVQKLQKTNDTNNFFQSKESIADKFTKRIDEKAKTPSFSSKEGIDSLAKSYHKSKSEPLLDEETLYQNCLV